MLALQTMLLPCKFTHGISLTGSANTYFLSVWTFIVHLFRNIYKQTISSYNTLILLSEAKHAERH